MPRVPGELLYSCLETLIAVVLFAFLPRPRLTSG